MEYEKRVAWISKAISDMLGQDVELDECAKIVIAAAIDAGIPVADLEQACENI